MRTFRPPPRSRGAPSRLRSGYDRDYPVGPGPSRWWRTKTDRAARVSPDDDNDGSHGVVVCTGTLFWIGNQAQFSGQATLESDDAGLNYRLWITPNTIPAPNTGSVQCPTTGLQFPTVDPNSPFVPGLENENKLFPVSGTGTRLTGGLPYLGDSGIGGFVASPARITYNVSWDLTATGVLPPDPPEDPDCHSSGSIIGCLDQILGEIFRTLEAEARNAATPEGAKSEYERMVDEIGKAAEENATSLQKKIEDLYNKARRALCGDDGTTHRRIPRNRKAPIQSR